MGGERASVCEKHRNHHALALPASHLYLSAMKHPFHESEYLVAVLRDVGGCPHSFAAWAQVGDLLLCCLLSTALMDLWTPAGKCTGGR